MTHRWLVTATCAAVLIALPLIAQAQDTYLDTDSTVNTALPGHLYIGQNTTDPITVDLVPGGSVSDNTVVRNNALLNIVGGELQRNLTLSEQARLNITSGQVAQGIQGNEASSLTISGGTFGRGVDTSGTAQANISGGTFGFSYDITGAGNSLITVTGGTFGGRGVASNSAIVNILGGAFARDLRAQGDSGVSTQIATLNLRGGTFGGELVSSGSNALLNIYGFNLQLINPTIVSLGTQYDLLGTLEDGTSLVGKNLLVISNGVVNLVPAGGAAAPEPGTFALMAFALAPVIGIVRRRTM